MITGDALGKNIELARLFLSTCTGDGVLVGSWLGALLGALLGASLKTSSTFLCNVVRLLLLAVSITCGWYSPGVLLTLFVRLLLQVVSMGIGRVVLCKGLSDIV